MVSTSVMFSLSITARGVPAGATTACQEAPSTPGKPISGVVGTSGSSDERSVAVITSALSRPAFTCGRKAGMVLNAICTLPDIISGSA